MIEVQRKTENIYPLIFLCVAVLLLLEIPLKSAIILVYVLAVIAGAGQKIAAKVGYNDVGIGIGIVVGVGAFVFNVQLLLIVGIAPALAHWSVILGMTAVLIFGRSRQSKPLITNKFLKQSDNYMAASVALVVTTLRQPWMLPFTFVVVAIGIWHHRSKPTTKSVFIGSLLATIGWFASSLLRPNLWWYFYAASADSQFFESLSWSIAKWGIFEHPGFVGGSIAKYHWLTYAFFGGLSELAQLEPWSALHKIGPLLICFLVAQLMIALSKESVSPRLAWHWIIIVLGVMTTRSQVVDSWALSIVVALTFLHLARLRLNAPKLHLSLFWVFLSATLLFAKIPTAVVVAVILGIKVFLDRNKPLLPQAVPLISLIFTGIALAIPVSRGPAEAHLGLPHPSTSAIKHLLMALISPDGFLPNVLICVGSAFFLRSLLKMRLGSTGFSIALLTLPSLLASALSYSENATGVLATVKQVSAEYFLTTPAILLTIFCSIEVLSLNTGGIFKKTKNQNALIIFIVLIGFIAGIYWRHRSIGVLFGSAVSLEVLSVLAIIAILSVATVLTFVKKILFYVPKVALSLFVLISGVLFGFKVNNFFRSLNNPAQYYSQEETTRPNFATSDLIAVGKFIRDNISQDTVLASNNFYPDQLQGGANYLLPAETRKRFLMQGLQYQTGLLSPSAEQIQRMNLSLEFAYQPSALVLKRLKEYGVKGYVVNLALTDRRDWSEFATEAFRSGDFVFLVLN